jgi:two-component system response regulator AtoC
VRVIALTNRDLQGMVRDKSFRNDLFYRLNVFPIYVVPVRERPEDILPLARHFLATLQPKLGRRFDGFDREAENRLLAYSWPGNVRELRNVVERAMVLERGTQISPRALILDWGPEADPGPAPLPGPSLAGGHERMPEGIVPLEEMEREMVARAMRAAGDNQTRAAELLGVTRDQLRHRLKKFGEPAAEY